MRKQMILLIFFLSVYHFGFCQISELKKIIPPSPTSTEFNKYINYNVSLYNGMPEISIPLYEVNVGGTMIPISISYHASGIKYSQSSGDIGVGWVLNPGYRISRTMYGRPDELHTKPAVPDFSSYSKKDRDIYLSKFIQNGDDDDLPRTGDYYDGEFDIFNYSNNSSSGSFVLEDRNQKIIKQFSHSNSEITYTQLANKSIDFFNIRDGNGVLFRYGKRFSGEKSIESNGFMGLICPSAWMLTDILDPFGNSANFFYQSYIEMNNRVYETYLVQPGFLRPGGGSWCSLDNFVNRNPNPQNSYTVQRLSMIQTPQVSINFYRKGGEGMLDSLVIRDNNNRRIKKISFFGASNSVHYFLDSIHVFGKTNINPQSFRFNYYNKEHVLSSGSFIEDYWGYNKFKNSVWPGYPDFENYFYCKSESNPVSYTAGYLIMDKVNKNPTNSEDAKYYSLSEIIYPTGGKIKYEYEPNKYLGIRDDLQGDTKYAGLRIKRIQSNLDGKIQMNKEYRYGVNEDGFGEVAFDVAHMRYYRQEKLIGICENYGLGQNEALYSRYVQFSNSPTTEINTIRNSGSPVHYGKVTEYETNYPSTNGKTEYVFQLPQQRPISAYSKNETYTVADAFRPGQILMCSVIIPEIRPKEYYDFFISKIAEWEKPQLISKSIFKYDLNQYKLVFKEQNIYSDMAKSTLFGIKVNRFVKTNFDYSPTYNYYNGGLESLFEYGEYMITFGNNMLTKQVTTQVGLNDQILTQESKFNYNQDFQLIREEKKNSKNYVIISKFKYPIDYGSITGLDNISKGIKNLISMHVLNPVVESTIEQKKPEASNNNFISSIFYSFHKDKPVIEKIFKVESIESIQDFSGTYNLNGAFIFDNRYKPKISFSKYDNKGNLLEQNKTDDVVESYLWGYDSQYPVAKIVNSGYDLAVSLVNPSILNSPVNDGYLRNELKELRTSLLNAFVTTYTYEPLIGMTSQTDENNKSTFFEYDLQGRLTLIRDQDKNIIKKICYNFAGQPEDCHCENVLANWQNTVTTLRCKKDINNNNTGEQEQEQKDMNSCSSTFNQIRWIVTGTNLANCPIIVTCNLGNCSGDNKKCLNNICERGIKVYTDTYQSGGQWVCVYHYEWSDGSWSQNFTQISSLPCVILKTL